jgi:hypothetical protein
MYKTKLPLTKKDLDFFQDQGYLYVENFWNDNDVAPVLNDIHRIIEILLLREDIESNRKKFNSADFDDGLHDLLRRNRALGGVVYDAVKKIPSYIKLAANDQFETISKFLLRTDFVGFVARGWGLRLDHPNEDEYNTQLHQEFVSQICSPRGVVFWTPLRDVYAEMGPIIFYPGSHKGGVYPIQIKGAGSYGQRIQDEKELEHQFSSVCQEVKKNDCLILDFLTLHKSSPNRSNKTRWASISRYFDYLDPLAKRIGWAGGIQEGGHFEKILPEFTVFDRTERNLYE